MAISLALTTSNIPLLSIMGDDIVRQFIDPDVPEVIVTKEVGACDLAKILSKLYLELIIMTVIKDNGDAVVTTPTFNYHVAETMERVYYSEIEGVDEYDDDDMAGEDSEEVESDEEMDSEEETIEVFNDTDEEGEVGDEQE